jgi:hypothetical protein
MTPEVLSLIFEPEVILGLLSYLKNSDVGFEIVHNCFVTHPFQLLNNVNDLGIANQDQSSDFGRRLQLRMRNVTENLP